MKKFLGTTIALLFVLTTLAQVRIKGKISGTDNQPLAGVSVQLFVGNKSQFNTVTDNNGMFVFTSITNDASCRVIITYTGLETQQKNFKADTNKDFVFVMSSSEKLLDPLEVKAVRAADRSPFTKTNITKAEIAQANLGQDLPFLLNQTPSVTLTSDAGNGIGYTGIRIRGSDASRINVTLNGIPYNDAESQGTYFVDLPDILSSTGSIQVQRGVGTSTNGAGAFGATINLSTNTLNENAYAEINNSFGSFNSWKNTISLGSGLLNDHFTIDARLSNITSNGYVDRASSTLQSYYLSAAYINDKTTLRFNTFSGREKTYQSWYGINKETLENDRTYNPAGTEKSGEPYDNQTDNYVQTHYQLFFTRAFSNNLSLNVASFLTRGKGYYEEYKADRLFSEYKLPDFVLGDDTITQTNLVRQLWLDNYYYGQTVALAYKKNNNEITFGGSWAQYDGKHYGRIPWAQFGIPKDYEYYHLTANKTDINAYTKWLRRVNTKWNAFADIQYRHVAHTMNGFKYNPSLVVARRFDFINPKAGISYYYNGVNAYVSYALAHKEPNRDDFEAGPRQQPAAETLHDIEMGFEKKGTHYNVGATLYYMGYKNQLVLTGKLNDVGSYTRVNTPQSYRTGIELQGQLQPLKWFSINAGATFSRNKVRSFTEYIDNYDDGKQDAITHHNTDISFSPAVIANGSLVFLPVKNLSLNLMAKYVGSQFLDNTQNDERKLAAYFTQDMRVGYSLQHVIFRETTIILHVNNIWNNLYEPNGYTYPYIYDGSLVNDNYYYPMAGTNFMIALNIKL